MLEITRAFRLVTLAAALCVTASAAAQQPPVSGANAPGESVASRLQQFRGKVQALQNIQTNNNYLESLLVDQQKTKEARRRALANLGTVEQGIVAHLVSMIDDLEAFVRMDLPFLADERQRRVASLRAMMQSSGVSIAEKYRLILETYQIETGFGREVEAYAGWLETGESRREVDFLRVGRLVLTYQTRDRSETGFWNSQSSPPGWQTLSAEQGREITRGLRIALKQAAPDWLALPVQAPPL